jgi:Tfp pilus assembly PilM family ATPase
VLAPEGCDLREALEMLTDEIQLSLRYHESLFPGRKVDRIVFVGGEARNRAVCQHIGRVLQAPAQVGDPMARAARTGSEPSVGVDLKEPQPGWTVPLGLCMSPTDL